ncbi:MAG TPA: hypothetical protein VJ691_02180 [Vicinamibacterales bacterium]|nr:hypothetical protein [Vicinamibacterales bacterium]
MFLGHYALAFGAKRLAPSVSLGTLFLACQFADLLWPSLVLLGFERVEIDPGNTLVTPLNFVSYPYSHSLVMLLVWSAVFALLYRAIRGPQPVAIATVGALVFSHFVLDVITHRPDMPITIGGTQKIGLGLWNYPGTTLAVESAMFLAGLALFVRATREKDRTGQIGLLALIATLAAVYFAALYGPPPPNARAVAIVGHLSWLFVLWAYWIDRHRQPRVHRRARTT